MGYHTDFYGQFDVTPVLSEDHKNYLVRFSETRRMKRDPDRLPSDPIREQAGLPPGFEGAYFVGGLGYCGQDSDSSVIQSSIQPKGQPGLWCQWIPNEDGTAIVWDEGEKFYEYVEWIEYLMKHFFTPWGYALSGKVRWQGQDPDDRGMIKITDNIVQAETDKMTNSLNEE